MQIKNLSSLNDFPKSSEEMIKVDFLSNETSNKKFLFFIFDLFFHLLLAIDPETPCLNTI